MEPAMSPLAEPDPRPPINWESFYVNYRKPGYVPGFEIINKLGGGVFGLVYKARKESIGKDYAIKFLKVDDEVVRELHLAPLALPAVGVIDGVPRAASPPPGHQTSALP